MLAIPGNCGRLLYSELLEDVVELGRERRNSDCGTAALVLEPSEDRFAARLAVLAPLDRFSEVSPVVGMGKKVGVDGRELEVGMDVAVPELPADSREAGRRSPGFAVL